MHGHRNLLALVAALLSSAMLPGCGGDDDSGGGGVVPMVIMAAGADDVAAAVEQFRDLLGEPNNGGTPGSMSSGRRELNWDGVPDEFSAPNFLPNDFFNDDEAPRARGIIFSTPGEGVQVSADADNEFGAARRFGNINPEYADSFVAFSQERLFSPIGSNIVDLTFRIPGTENPATVSGFGAVYTGVDGISSLEFFDVLNNSLGQFFVPVSEDGLSFLGIRFEGLSLGVRRIRIAYGNSALGPDESSEVDVAVMDDFFYSEPRHLILP